MDFFYANEENMGFLSNIKLFVHKNLQICLCGTFCFNMLSQILPTFKNIAKIWIYTFCLPKIPKILRQHSIYRNFSVNFVKAQRYYTLDLSIRSQGIQVKHILVQYNFHRVFPTSSKRTEIMCLRKSFIKIMKLKYSQNCCGNKLLLLSFIFCRNNTVTIKLLYAKFPGKQP